MNYSITWSTHDTVSYKFFHKFHSIVPESTIGGDAYRYPFADIFVFSYDEKFDLLTYRKPWKSWLPGIGFSKSIKWPNGTKLAKFGHSEMRVSIENERWIETLYDKNWRNVGKTHWYDHKKNFRKTQIKFEINSRLYAPAKPFY